MNSDTFSALNPGTARNQLQALSGLGTTETIFTVGADLGANPAAVQIPLQNAIVGSSTPIDPNASPAASIDVLGMSSEYNGSRGRPYFNSGSFDGHPFLVRVAGKFTTSAAAGGTAHSFNLKQNTSAVLAGANSIISALSTTALAAGSYGFLIEAELMWDSVSQSLIGEAWSVVAGNYTSRASVSVPNVTAYTSLLFVASTKLSTGTTNAVTPVEFSISQV